MSSIRILVADDHALVREGLRYVLDTEKAGRDQVPLQQELDFTRDYLALEALHERLLEVIEIE